MFDGYLQELKKLAEDSIPGGLADGKPHSKYDSKQLAMGKKVELEHTDDPKKAKEIAADHLEEHRDYYTRLKKMEDQAEREKKANGDEEEGGRAPTPADKAKILAWVKKNPKPSDEQFHEFAEGLGVDKHKAEETVYAFAHEKTKKAMIYGLPAMKKKEETKNPGTMKEFLELIRRKREMGEGASKTAADSCPGGGRMRMGPRPGMGAKRGGGRGLGPGKGKGDRSGLKYIKDRLREGSSKEAGAKRLLRIMESAGAKAGLPGHQAAAQTAMRKQHRRMYRFGAGKGAAPSSPKVGIPGYSAKAGPIPDTKVMGRTKDVLHGQYGREGDISDLKKVIAPPKVKKAHMQDLLTMGDQIGRMMAKEAYSRTIGGLAAGAALGAGLGALTAHDTTTKGRARGAVIGGLAGGTLGGAIGAISEGATAQMGEKFRQSGALNQAYQSGRADLMGSVERAVGAERAAGKGMAQKAWEMGVAWARGGR